MSQDEKKQAAEKALHEAALLYGREHANPALLRDVLAELLRTAIEYQQVCEIRPS